MTENEKERLANFLKEFKALQDKYSACVSYRMEGDTHGIDEDSLTVRFLEPLRDGDRFRAWSKEIDIDY